MRSIPNQITNNPNSVWLLLCHLDCCIILHNILIDKNDKVTQSWIDELGNEEVDDVAQMIGKYDYSAPIVQGAAYERRRQLIEYLIDVVLIYVNNNA